MEVLDSICAKLSLNELEKFQPLKELSDKAHVKPGHIGLGVLALALILVLLGYGTSLIAFMVGFLYPAYMSFKALESKESNDDDKHWLTYWVVFGSMNVFDRIINFVFSFVPFLSLVKIGFYIYLFHPKTKGALTVYQSFLRPTLNKYQNKIDENISKIGDQVEKVGGQVVKNATDAATNEAVKRVIQ